MNKILVLLFALCITVPAGPIYAQNKPKQWLKTLQNWMNKQTPAAKKEINANKLLPEPISFDRSIALENRLLALIEMSRVLRANPLFTNTPAFENYIVTLNQLGESVPLPPGPNATLAQKHQYAIQAREYIIQRLKTEETTLALHMRPKDPFTKAITSPHINWSKRRHEMTLANAHSEERWEALKQSISRNTKIVSWGEKNWNEIRIVPFYFLSAQDPQATMQNVIVKLTQETPQSFIQMMNTITFHPTLTPYEKQVLWNTLAKTNDVLDFQYIYNYITTCKAFPKIFAPGLLEQENSPSLQQYAKDAMLQLVDDFKQGKPWDESKINAFIDLSVYLPGHNAQDVLAALTYLEPKAALYLLSFPGENKTTQNIRREIQAARKTANGNPIQKSPVQQKIGVFGVYRRMMALTVYHNILSQRLRNLEQQMAINRFWIQNENKTNAELTPTPERQAYRLYQDLRFERLIKLHSLISTRAKEVQMELAGLYFASPMHEQESNF